MTTKRHYWMEADQKEGLGLGLGQGTEADRSGDENGHGHGHGHGSGEEPDPSEVPGGAWALSRRTFLAAAGFTTAGMLAACGRAPAQKTAPALKQPEDVVPGRATWYASTCGGCPAGCGVLVKCRDGRPIKVEGNPDHPVSRGGLCAIGQAQVIGLYDSRRPIRPSKDGVEVSWDEVDREIGRALETARASGAGVRILTGTVTSPTTRSWIDRFLAAFPNGRHVAFDALPASAILDAHEKTHGARVLPRYHFEKAMAIVGLDADFLGTWISPVEFTRSWREGRTLEGKPPRMSWHAQCEPAMTLTGSNADLRRRVAPHEIPALAAHLANAVAERTGAGGAPRPAASCPIAAKDLATLADRLVAAKPNALVVCGRHDVATQVLVNATNHALGAYGETLDVAAPSRQRAGSDAAFQALVDEMEAGKVSVLLVAGANPVVEAPGGKRFRDALSRVPTRVAVSTRRDETSAGLSFLLPAPHALESWDDAEPVAGVLSVAQPAIRPLGEPRTLRQCLAAWTGRAASDRDLLHEAWAREQFPRQSAEATAERFWRKSVHDGFAIVAPPPTAAKPFDASAVAAVAERPAPSPGRFSLVLLPSVSMLDGRHAENPWLQELPDPIAKTTWGNAAALSPAAAKALGVESGDVVRIAGAGGAQIEAPVRVQPGTHECVVALALGYGRAGTERFHGIGPRWLEANPTVEKDRRVGTDASPLLAFEAGAAVFAGVEVTVERTGRHEDLALSQTYDLLDLPARTAPKGGERRDAVRETTLAAFVADPAAGNPRGHGVEDVWAQDHAYAGHRWGMAIDLTACTGCSACVVACQAENNVPVVGKDEVRRRRDLQWIRLDRYYSDVPGEAGEVEVVHQPMLCQHCGNAPCETVCPVLATVHSSEGLNAQVYNRCVGTRYCANNCPYKARRFNWFDYRREDPLTDLVLNPDVTVRTRGVMEKCSFCVQRIHEAKAEAKRRGVPVKDGDVQPACQQSCPARAIVFGDLNDPKSAVAKAHADPRAYRVLEELNVQPSIAYETKVRSRDGAGRPAKGGGHG
jgi:molybdopterin-containing oxidoreductase family iron-sulfur binding subunit